MAREFEERYWDPDDPRSHAELMADFLLDFAAREAERAADESHTDMDASELTKRASYLRSQKQVSKPLAGPASTAVESESAEVKDAG